MRAVTSQLVAPVVTGIREEVVKAALYIVYPPIEMLMRGISFFLSLVLFFYFFYLSLAINYKLSKEWKKTRTRYKEVNARYKYLDSCRHADIYKER